jgi:hypothetical protein
MHVRFESCKHYGNWSEGGQIVKKMSFQLKHNTTFLHCIWLVKWTGGHCMLRMHLEHSRRVNVNIVDKFGYTALHLAAHSQCHGSCNKVIAKMLKMTNADPNVVAI